MAEIRWGTRRCGASVGADGGRQRRDCRAAERVSMVGIDCPLGWPTAVRRPADRRRRADTVPPTPAPTTPRNRLWRSGGPIVVVRERDRALAAERRRPTGSPTRPCAAPDCSARLREAGHPVRRSGIDSRGRRGLPGRRAAELGTTDCGLQDEPVRADRAGGCGCGPRALVGLGLTRGMPYRDCRRPGRRHLRCGRRCGDCRAHQWARTRGRCDRRRRGLDPAAGRRLPPSTLR